MRYQRKEAVMKLKLESLRRAAPDNQRLGMSGRIPAGAGLIQLVPSLFSST